jgi:hypothetical protein
MHTVRVHTGADDDAYSCMGWGPDREGTNGVWLRKDVPLQVRWQETDWVFLATLGRAASIGQDQAHSTALSTAKLLLVHRVLACALCGHSVLRTHQFPWIVHQGR